MSSTSSYQLKEQNTSRVVVRPHEMEEKGLWMGLTPRGWERGEPTRALGHQSWLGEEKWDLCPGWGHRWARGPSPPAPPVTLAQVPRTQVSPPPATLGVEASALKLISGLPQSQGLDFWTRPSPGDLAKQRGKHPRK